MKTNTNQIQDLTKWVDPKATAERGRESEQERDKVEGPYRSGVVT